MPTIDDVPDAVTDAGQTFDYTPPVRLADVVLVNAPLDPDHANIGLNAAAYDTFIDAEITAGRAYVADNVNLQNPEHDLVLPIEYEEAVRFYNYGRVTIGGRPWYIFYTAVYQNKTSTRFVADIDEIPSYDWTLGYSMIERGHIAVAASQNDPYGSTYLTAPEPIAAPPVQGVLGQNLLGSTPGDWTVLVISANDLRGSGGFPYFGEHIEWVNISNAADLATSATVDSAANPQTVIDPAHYPWTEIGTGDHPIVYVPKVTASPLSTIDGIAAGGGVYLFTPSGFAEYMTHMQGASWVIEGIVDIRLVPSWAVSGGGGAGFTPTTPGHDPTSGEWNAVAAIPNFVGQVTTASASPTVLTNWRASALAAVGATGWTKLITAQFTDLLIGNGDSLTSFSPDQWQTPSIQFTAVTGAAHGDPSIRLIPVGYNELGSQMGVDTPVGGSAGFAYTGYSQAASNTATAVMGPYLNAFSSRSTWDVQFRQRQLALTLGLTGIQMNLGVQGIETALGGLIGAAGGALTGGPVGAAVGVASAASGLGGLVTASINASNSINLLDISTDGSFDIGAFQLGVSGVGALASFEAWNQSLDSKSGGGRAHQLASAWRALLGQAFKIIISMPSQERINALISQWTRYGYMIEQAFVPPQLNAMSRYTYWKTREAIVTGAVPQTRRQTISAAFDRGVTVWNDLADIGTKPANIPLSGISY